MEVSGEWTSVQIIHEESLDALIFLFRVRSDLWISGGVDGKHSKETISSSIKLLDCIL